MVTVLEWPSSRSRSRIPGDPNTHFQLQTSSDSPNHKILFMVGSAFLAFLRLAAVSAASLIPCLEASQGPDIVMGQLTNLRSSVEGVISNRFQKHSWITTDGRTHLLINVGSSFNALELYSSGCAVTWFKRAAIPNIVKTSQADGALVGSRLYVVYSTRDRQIELATLDYMPSLSKWKKCPGSFQ